MNLFHIKVDSSTIQPVPIIPRLRLPNIALGDPKTSIKKLSELKDWTSVSDLFPSKVHYSFNWGTVDIDGDEVKVDATVPGEYAIPVPFCKAGKSDIMILQLTVIQSSWVLFSNVKEPPPDAPYKKENTDDDEVVMPEVGVRIVAASRRGQSHAFAGTFRDDDYLFKVYRIANDDVFLLAVADGAGSAKYARMGSKLAVNAAVNSLHESLCQIPAEGKEDVWLGDGIGKLLANAARDAQKAIISETEAPSEDNVGHVSDRDYNTTLLLSAVRITEKKNVNIISFSIGDGAIAWVSNDNTKLLSEPDDGKFAGETDFITSNSLWQQFDSDPASFLKRRVKTVNLNEQDSGMLLMMTDGVSDPFFASHAKLREPDIWRSFVDNKLRQEAKIDQGLDASTDSSKKLLSWLDFKVNAYTDDRTIVLWELERRNKKTSVSSETNKEEVAQ